jgi:hypothetical protein
VKRGHRFDFCLLLSPSARERLPTGARQGHVKQLYPSITPSVSKANGAGGGNRRGRAVNALHAEGKTTRAIARELDANADALAKWIKTAE